MHLGEAASSDAANDANLSSLHPHMGFQCLEVGFRHAVV
jgi:hypothetical protein